MSKSWEPSADAAGARAAVVAVGSAGSAHKHSRSGSDSVSKGHKASQDSWGNSAAAQAFRATRPVVQQPKSTDGSSAATQAFNISRTRSMKKSPPPTADDDERPLAAAKGAMSMRSNPRPRATSTPIAPLTNTATLQSSAASSALSGAASAHRASMQPKAPIGDAGAVSVTTMTRNMFTSHPPVKPETDEADSNAKIHQSAVAMARKMYAQQQKMLEQAKEARAEESEPQAPVYTNLQDAAYKQAQERLAKLHDEHQKNREIQEYYGQAPTARRRFSVSTKLRRRASSDGAADDRVRSERIRQEMSQFSHKLSEVDKSKRDKDREALLAAAQRNVRARLQGMDEKVYNDTGKINPSKLGEWEAKAQKAAQSRHEAKNVNRGKLDLGGGFFMDPEEIDAIAAKRVQPVLDEINEKAAAERARVAARKAEEEARREEREKQKSRELEEKENVRKAKGKSKPQISW